MAQTDSCALIFREIPADSLTPSALLEIFKEEISQGTLLEYGLDKIDSQKYSCFYFNLMDQLLTTQGITTLQSVNGSRVVSKEHPLTLIRQFQENLASKVPEGISGLMNGIVGFITYDAIRFFEDIPDDHLPDPDLPEILFKYYRSTIVFDHQKKKIMISHVIDDIQIENNFLLAKAKVDSYIQRIKEHSSFEKQALNSQEKKCSAVEIDVPDSHFIDLVEKAKKYIREGDVFQVVLSRCFYRNYQATPFEIYMALRTVSPSPYLFYLGLEDRVVLGASPERLISVENGRVSINPIAGTRKRSNEKPLELTEKDLLSDEKELAEHRMLVDLARNDVGSVCKPGSIQVTEYAQVKHFSHVSHITSMVEGDLKEELDAFDALFNSFPAGTLSGAPKIRAMEIIDELETSRRGLYGGAIVRCDFKGNLESCIAIRMSVLKEGVATVRTGAGIVYDSNPSLETMETRQKANSMLAAIAFAEGELFV